MLMQQATLSGMSAFQLPVISQMTVGDKIRQARTEKGWKQYQLAEAIDVSTQAVNRYENDKRNISVDMLTRIAEVLDKPEGYFFDGGDGLSNEERDLIDHLRSNPRHLTVVKSTLRGLREVEKNRYEAE